MRSVKDLYENYSFQEACDNLMTIIESALKSKDTGLFVGARTNVTIPNPIIQVFLLHPEMFKDWISQMEDLGYRFNISSTGDRIEIYFRVSKNLEQEQVQFFKKIQKIEEKDESKDIRSLLGDDVLVLIKKSMSEHKDRWTLSEPPTRNCIKLLYTIDRSNKIEIKISSKDSDSYVFLRYEDSYFYLSSEQKESLLSFIDENFDMKQIFIDNLNKVLSY